MTDSDRPPLWSLRRDPATGRYAMRTDRHVYGGEAWTLLDEHGTYLTEPEVAGWDPMPHTVPDLLAGVPFEASGVEAWIREFRESWPAKSDKWWAVDEILDDYRLHAHTGTPLNRHACEGEHCNCPEDVA